MELEVDIDSRENCTASLSPDDFRTLTHPYIRLVDIQMSLYVVEDKSMKPKTLRMSKDFAACLGLPYLSTVTCVSIPTIPTRPASPIIVSPASVDDWEVVESQASFLESTILSQIRIVSKSQKFPIWTSRGQRPVVLQVTGGIGDDPVLLGVDTELAVEARVRREIDLTGVKRGYLPVRVVDTGFPCNTPDLLGVGMIVNTGDFVRVFGEEAGCVVTVRDRPEILSVIACDSGLVDPGVVLVAPVMRDRYGLAAGERIVIEQQRPDVVAGLITPSVFHVGFPTLSSLTRSQQVTAFMQFVENATCVVVPQGGWLDVSSSHEPTYVRAQFDPPMHGQTAVSNASAIITPKSLGSIQVTTLAPSEESGHPIPRPYLKHVGEKIREDSISIDVVTDRRRCVKIPSQPIPSFAPVISRISAYLEASLTNASPDLPFAGSVLLTSSSAGGGRTTAARQAMDALSPPLTYVVIDCGLLSNPNRYSLGEVKDAISGLIRFGFESPPFGILFDGIDQLIPPEPGETEETIRRSKRGKVIGAFLHQILTELRPNRSIVLVGTAVRDSLALAKIFIHSERLPSKLSTQDKEYLLPLSNRSPDLNLDGYSLMEIVEIRNTGVDNRELRRRLLAGNQKSVVARKCRGLGGLRTQTQQLIDAITLPLHFPFLFHTSDNKPLMSTGAFVVGPTGTGKSALIDFVVQSVNLPVEIVRGPDLLDKYIGASEQGVRRVFEKAASVAPCVLVFDTIDALCPRRGSESTGVTDRVVNQMLCYLDGVEKLEGVFVIAVTSRPDMVDPALSRPGRLDMVILCDIPTRDEKLEIVDVLFSEFFDAQSGIVLSEADRIHLVDKLPANATGADIRAAFVNAKIASTRTKSDISLAMVKKCMSEVRPSISDKDARMYNQQFAKYRTTTAGPSPPGVVNSDSVGSRVMLH